MWWIKLLLLLLLFISVLLVEGRSYTSTCGGVRGHGFGGAFINAIVCNCSLDDNYVEGVPLTHGPAGKRRHLWTFAAAWADVDLITHNTIIQLRLF